MASATAEVTLGSFVSFLRFHRHGGDRSSLESTEPDFLPGFLAVAVGALGNAFQGGVDFANQFAFPVAGFSSSPNSVS